MKKGKKKKKKKKKKKEKESRARSYFFRCISSYRNHGPCTSQSCRRQHTLVIFIRRIDVEFLLLPINSYLIFV